MIIGKGVTPRKLDIAAFEQALVVAANQVAGEVLKDFQATVATWSEENKPRFGKIVDVTGGEIALLVGVDSNGDIYRYVSEGTRPHLIPKAGPGILAFSEGYSPKTMPGVIGARSGGASGARVIRKTQIKHPGTEARKFDEVIAKKWVKPFKRAMEDALKRAARASGHGGR